MSFHKKYLNLQEDTGETFNIALDDSKTVLKNSNGPIEIQTERLCVKNGLNIQLVDVVGTINKNTTDISTEISLHSSAISTEISVRSAAIASETNSRTSAIASETSSRTSAIASESADRAAAIAAVIDTINNNNNTTSSTTAELSNEISIVQTNIASILENADGSLDSFNEIVTAYESADTDLQEFINSLTTRLATAENIVSTLTVNISPAYTGVRALFQPAYNGSFGYFNIKMVGTATAEPNYLYMEEGGALTVYARPAPTSEGQFGISHVDNNTNPDEHVWKVTKVAGSNLFMIENTAYPGQYIGEYGSVYGPTTHVSMHNPPQLFIEGNNSTTDTDGYHMSIKGNDGSKFKAYWYVVNQLYHYVDFHGLNNQNYNDNNISFKFEPIS